MNSIWKFHRIIFYTFFSIISTNLNFILIRNEFNSSNYTLKTFEVINPKRIYRNTDKSEYNRRCKYIDINLNSSNKTNYGCENNSIYDEESGFYNDDSTKLMINKSLIENLGSIVPLFYNPISSINESDTSIIFNYHVNNICKNVIYYENNFNLSKEQYREINDNLTSILSI